jgi:transcriptional regulator of acetoin/glycerol metabolism
MRTLVEVERDYIAVVLAQTNCNIGQSARILGIARNTLYRKIHYFKLMEVAPVCPRPALKAPSIT